MRNKVEILRAIEFTKDDLDSITNLDEIDSFSDKDKEFMEEFKKIYELGLDQLVIFIDKLDQEGSELDEYSIQYYVTQLLNGPLGQYTRELSVDKNYFQNTPDSLGTSGNNETTSSNISIIEKSATTTMTKVDTYNKLPLFMQELLSTSCSISEEVFRNGMRPIAFMDNTLPILDKNPQERYSKDSSGEWQKTAHGSLCVKDTDYKNILSEVNQQVFEKVKENLNDENYRIFKDKKEFNPFDPEKNDSTSESYIIKRDIDGQELDTNICGDIYDSFERRESKLKIENSEKNVEYDLYTNEGQLGFKP